MTTQCDGFGNGLTCIALWSFLYQIVTVRGHADGPPIGTCLNFFPKHGGQEAQFTDPPYIIDIKEDNYVGDQNINITIRGKDRRTLMGIQIAFHRRQGDTEEFIGEFVKFPEEKVMTYDCIDGKNNMIGHWNNDPVNEINVTWRAPTSNEGNLTMFTTVVENFDMFWVNIKNSLPSSIDVPHTLVPQADNTKGVQIHFDGCGQTHGCILYPAYCTDGNCDVGVTFKDEGNRTRFQIFATQEDGYISVGFSADRWMGTDHTISCTVKDGEYTVQHGYNPEFYNYRQYKKDELKDMIVAQEDGKLKCEFTRPKVMSVVNRFKPNERLTFDINQEYYVMIAWGEVPRGAPALLHHTELPITTYSKVNFKSTLLYRGAALPQLTQIHGLLMLIAWILFTGLSTIVARYFKFSFGEKSLFGAKLWFQLHRFAAILVALMTSVSFIIIFVRVKSFTEVAESHAYFGIALMSTTTIQIISGVFRPDAPSKVRPLFNFGHWLLGKSSHILSVVAIVLAFTIQLIPKTQSKFGVIIASIWVTCQILWELFFEIRLRRSGKREKTGRHSMQKADTVLLILYLLNMTLVLAVSVLAIYFF